MGRLQTALKKPSLFSKTRLQLPPFGGRSPRPDYSSSIGFSMNHWTINSRNRGGTANGPYKELLFPKTRLQPPSLVAILVARSAPGLQFQHRVLDEPLDAVAVLLVVPTLRVLDVDLCPGTQVREPLLDRLDENRSS